MSEFEVNLHIVALSGGKDSTAPEYCLELATPRLAAAERGQTLDQYRAGQKTIFDFMEESSK